MRLGLLFMLMLLLVLPAKSQEDERTTGRQQAGQLQQALPGKRTAVLHYMTGQNERQQDELQLEFISRNEHHFLRLPEAKMLKRRLIAFQNQLQHKSKFDKELAAQLYRSLITPALPWLKGKTRLIILPHKDMAFIPFEALVPDTASSRFLLHEYAISYARGFSSLLQEKNPGSNDDRNQVLAIATFHQQTTEKEVMNIKADRLLGSNASREGFLKKAADYSIIHLATPVKLNSPGGPYIDFRPGDESDKEASRLYLNAIPQLCSLKANLVILSSGASLSSLPGDTLPGLFIAARAFSHAGCPNLISTLWNTEAQAVDKISMKLHQYIRSGADYADALQRARIAYLKNPSIDEKLKTPAYWASFVLVGEIDTRPESQKIFYYFALAATVLIVVYVLRRRKRRFRNVKHPEHC